MKRLIVIIAVMLGLGFIVVPTISAVDLLAPACTGAAANSPACQQNDSTTANNNPITGNNGAIHKTASFLATVTAISSIFVIIAAAIKFVTSGGKSDQIASAKSYLTYAIVGLIVSALAYVLASFFGSQLK